MNFIIISKREESKEIPIDHNKFVNNKVLTTIHLKKVKWETILKCLNAFSNLVKLQKTCSGK